MTEFTDVQLSVLTDMLDDFSDRLRHYRDAEMGWEPDEVGAFYDMYTAVRSETKRRKLFR